MLKFRRVARPAPPSKVLDLNHGTHEMIKLKVRSVSAAHLRQTRQRRSIVAGYLHSLGVQRLAQSAAASIFARLF